MSGKLVTGNRSLCDPTKTIRPGSSMTRIMLRAALLLVPALMLQPIAAYAYVGPTAGLSIFSAAVGMLVALLSAIAVILSWPIRMLVKWIRGGKSRNVEDAASASPVDCAGSASSVDSAV